MISISPLVQRLDHGDAIVLGAQRRIELEEGAVFADVVFVERQVVDRDARGDLGAAALAMLIASTEPGTETVRRDNGRRSAARCGDRVRAG